MSNRVSRRTIELLQARGGRSPRSLCCSWQRRCAGSFFTLIQVRWRDLVDREPGTGERARADRSPARWIQAMRAPAKRSADLDGLRDSFLPTRGCMRLDCRRPPLLLWPRRGFSQHSTYRFIGDFKLLKLFNNGDRQFGCGDAFAANGFGGAKSEALDSALTSARSVQSAVYLLFPLGSRFGARVRRDPVPLCYDVALLWLAATNPLMSSTWRVESTLCGATRSPLVLCVTAQPAASSSTRR